MSNYLIIGASSGIGMALASQLANEGHQVYGTYNRRASEIPLVRMHHLDITSQEMDLSFLPDVLEGLVYCPGLIDLKPFHRMKPAEFIDDYQVQVLGAIKVLQETYANLKKAEQASVVLFSTVAVQSGFPFHTKVSASKGAIEGFARALAAEWAPKVRVNVVAPSLTHTPLSKKLLNSEDKEKANAQRHPLRRIGNVEDMSNAAAFLLTRQSSWVTGQVLPVDGGISRLKV